MNNITLRVNALLSLQKALLGAITPNIRAVTCRWDEECITVKVIYNESPSEDELEELSCIETSIVSDLPDHDVCSQWVVRQAPMNINLDLLMACVYMRKEND